MTNNNNKGVNTKEQGVIYSGQTPKSPDKTAAPASSGSPIPEEFITDEDLYPDFEPESPNKQKRSLLLIIGVSVLIIFLVLFLIIKLITGQGAAKNQTVKLTYWGLWESPAVMQELITLYKKDHQNVQIDYVLMDAKDKYIDRLIERTKKRTGPDIFRYHNTWVNELGSLLSTAPETVLTAADYKKIYYPVINKDLIVNNKVIGVPLDLDGLVLVYNDRILKAAGFSAPPADWDTLWEIVKPGKGLTVTNENGEIVSAGIAMGASENIAHFSDILALMFLQNSVDFNHIGTDQNAASVMDIYTNLTLSQNKVWDVNQDYSINTFAQEKVAFIFAPLWQVEVIKKMKPDLQLKVAPVPQLVGGKKKGLASYWVEGVSSGSTNQKAAWEFLKWLGEKETLQKLYDLEVKNGRLFGMPYPRIEMADLLLNHEYLSPIIKDGPILDSAPLIDRTYDNGLNDKLIGYLKDAVNGILNNAGVAGSMTTLGNGFSQVFGEYQFEHKTIN